MSQQETVARHESNGTLEKPAESGRDSKGRFCKGNPGGPGNPFARQVAQLRQVFVDRVDEDKLEALVDMLLEKALAGDVAATKLVLAYSLGKPAPVVEPDELDAQEIELFRREQVPDFNDHFKTIPAALACEIWRKVIPARAEKFAQQFEVENNALEEARRLEKERLEKEAARRQAHKEAQQARQAQETPQQREARKAAARAARQKQAEKAAQRDEELPTVEQILAWARQGPEAALAEVLTVNKPAQTDGESPNPSQ